MYTENDQVMSREELSRAVVSGSDTVESAGNEDMRAYVHGNAAVVTGWLVMRGRGPVGRSTGGTGTPTAGTTAAGGGA